MNPKTLACIFLGLIIGAASYGSLMVHKKLAAMQAEEKKAEDAYKTAEGNRKSSERKLANLRRETQGKRDYLQEWMPYLQETRSEADSQQLMSGKVRESGLTALQESYKPVVASKNSSIGNLLQGKLTFVADYSKTLDWLGKIETSLPTSRISSFKISKGSSGNDIRSELIVDVPMYASANSVKK